MAQFEAFKKVQSILSWHLTYYFRNKQNFNAMGSFFFSFSTYSTTPLGVTLNSIYYNHNIINVVGFFFSTNKAQEREL